MIELRLISWAISTKGLEKSETGGKNEMLELRLISWAISTKGLKKSEMEGKKWNAGIAFDFVSDFHEKA